MPNENNRNTIAFLVVAGLLLVLYQVFVIGPSAKKAEIRREQAVAEQKLAPAAAEVVHLSRAAALAQTQRVRIDTPALSGSMSLTGARIDDLFLKNYRETVDKNSPPVELLRPDPADHAYFVETGWIGSNLPGLPTADSVWTLTSGSVLSPGHPITLRYAGGAGLTFDRAVSVDDKYMFTVTDTVANTGATAVSVTPYGSVQRQDPPPTLGKNNIVHEGGIGMIDATLKEEKYGKWKKDGEKDLDPGTGWIGITDKYWMTTLIPSPTEHFRGVFRVTPKPGSQVYEAAYTASQPMLIPAGRQVSLTTHIFAGAKTVPLLKTYEQSVGATKFEDAVDWGFLWILTKNIFRLVDYFYRLVGNFGVAILMLTVVIRLIMFPLAHKGFEMGVKMKKLQPQLQELQKKFKDDPAAQQKEMMALYAKEKVNPVTGCFPIFLQIPVFYSLTKLFTVTIEMRHAPFFGWIHDLSAPDPTTIWNLFGLIPWHPELTPLIGGILGTTLHLGLWPIAYGFTMWLTQSMTPTTGIDPTQQMIFKLMPILFTFILAQYAVGLIIYWTWSSLITILQQYVIMRRFKVDNPIDDFLGRFSSKPAASG